MHGAYVGLIVGVPLTGETVCLMAVAIQKDSHMVAAITIVGLAAAVSSALDSPLSRLRHGTGSKIYPTYVPCSALPARGPSSERGPRHESSG